MLPCFINACEALQARQHEFSMNKPGSFALTVLCLILLPACAEIAPAFLPTPTLVSLYQDAAAVVRGICFEAAYDAAQQNQTFVLRDTAAQIAFYDLADNSQLCRHPVERVPFDFSNGRVVAGLWNMGVGCTARHDVLDTLRDDNAKTLQLHLRFVTEGDCGYELVRPFWISVDGASDYAIVLKVE